MPTSKPLNDIIRIAENSENLPSTGKANKQGFKFTNFAQMILSVA